MPARSVSDDEAPRSRRPPATTPEARERQLVLQAMDLAEKQIQEGTASAQVITHFLKAGSTREFLEKERIRNENSLTQARIEMMESARRIESMYAEALDAMRAYQGQPPREGSDDEYYD